MTSRQYRNALKQLKLSIGGGAPKVLDVSVATAKRYASPEGSIPGPVARLLEMFMRHGIPEEWVGTKVGRSATK